MEKDTLLEERTSIEETFNKNNEEQLRLQGEHRLINRLISKLRTEEEGKE